MAYSIILIAFLGNPTYITTILLRQIKLDLLYNSKIK